MNSVQARTMLGRIHMLEHIDSHDIQGYYRPANLLARIYSARYIDNNTGLAKWLERRYKERYGDI